MQNSDQNTKWNQLYKVADDFFALQPWKLVDEVDIFGVRSPDTGKEYFISIMGSIGESYSLAAYVGREALNHFWNLQAAADKLPPGYLLRIPHMMISLDEPGRINQTQLEQMKRLGRDMTKNRLPHLVKMIPGLFPQNPADADLKDLLHILNQSIYVLKKVTEEGRSYIHSTEDHDQDYLFRTFADQGKKWIDKKVRVEPPVLKMAFTFNSATYDDFMKAPGNKNIVQLDLQFLQSPVDDGKNPPYFPSMLMAVDAKREIILFYELLPPFPDYDTMLSKLPEVIMQKSIDIAQKPTRIKYRNPDLDPVCEFLSRKTGIKAWRSDAVEQIDKAFHSLQDHMFGGENNAL